MMKSHQHIIEKPRIPTIEQDRRPIVFRTDDPDPQILIYSADFKIRPHARMLRHSDAMPDHAPRPIHQRLYLFGKGFRDHDLIRITDTFPKGFPFHNLQSRHIEIGIARKIKVADIEQDFRRTRHEDIVAACPFKEQGSGQGNASDFRQAFQLLRQARPERGIHRADIQIDQIIVIVARVVVHHCPVLPGNPEQKAKHESRSRELEHQQPRFPRTPPGRQVPERARHRHFSHETRRKKGGHENQQHADQQQEQPTTGKQQGRDRHIQHLFHDIAAREHNQDGQNQGDGRMQCRLGQRQAQYILVPRPVALPNGDFPGLVQNARHANQSVIEHGHQ